MMKTKDLAPMYYISRFQEALGADWEVAEYLGGRTPGLLVLRIPNDQGHLTVSVLQAPRWWMPGCGSYPLTHLDGHWLGVPLYGDKPYKGAKWVEQMVEDIKKAVAKL